MKEFGQPANCSRGMELSQGAGSSSPAGGLNRGAGRHNNRLPRASGEGCSTPRRCTAGDAPPQEAGRCSILYSRESKILLFGIFPRGETNDPVREQVKAINAQLAKLDDGKTVKFMDIGSKFLGPDGTLSRDIMPDLLHPNEKGYQIWADAMEGPLNQMLK